ncbi:MAG: AAA family ATPase, partial [bacterium]
MKKLPLGISDFKKLIEGDYIYVDKTEYIYELVKNGGYIFLSRPRRFGKSLLLSTIEYLFENQKELFKGLYIYEKWNWEEKYPVVRISFAADIKNIERFYEVVYNQLKLNYENFNIEFEKDLEHSGLLLENLIIKVNKKNNKEVVLLVDEYDKPILDLITDKKEAEEVRKELKAFYSVIKELDKYLKFVLITGVSKFSKVSLFSGLNQLEDISLVKEYGNICGYTQQELEYYFKDYLKEIDIQEVKEWYNGYNFLNDNVYNPFDVLLYLKYKVFKNYWYETGKTEFIFKIIKQREFELPYLEKRYYSYEILEKFDLEYINLEALMFQTGYLTIKEVTEIEKREMYKLGYPNREVQEAFNNELLFYIT